MNSQSYRVALIKGIPGSFQSEVVWHTLASDQYVTSQQLRSWLKCSETDYMSISPTHTMYVPCDPTAENQYWKVLTKCSEEDGEPVDLPEEDVRRLPEILENDARKRQEFMEQMKAMGAHVINI